MGHDVMNCDFCNEPVMEGSCNTWECDCGAQYGSHTRFRWQKPVEVKKISYQVLDGTHKEALIGVSRGVIEALPQTKLPEPTQIFLHKDGGIYRFCFISEGASDVRGKKFANYRSIETGKYYTRHLEKWTPDSFVIIISSYQADSLLKHTVEWRVEFFKAETNSQ